MKGKDFTRGIGPLFAALLLLVLAYVFLGNAFLPGDIWGEEASCSRYEGPFYRVMEDGRLLEFRPPFRCQAKKGETVTMVTRVPRSDKGTYLCFRSAKQDMFFYVDGTLRQQYTTRNTRLFGNANAMAYVFFPIREEDAGKPLVIVTYTDTSYSGEVFAVYQGSQMGIWKTIAGKYGLELVVAFLMIVLSLVVLCACMVLFLYYRKSLELFYLSCGIFIAGLWEIANSEFRQLFFSNLSVVNDLAFCAIMLMPLAFLQYINEVQGRRYKRWILPMELIHLAVFAICTSLHCTHLVDYTNMVVEMDALCVVSIVLMAATMVMDWRTGDILKYRLVAIGMIFAFIASIAQIIIYYQRTNIFNGAVFGGGLIILLLFAVAHTINKIIAVEKQNQQARMEGEAKGRFLANMSHEIRTPINTVLGLDTMILRESSESAIRQYALDIQSAGQSLLSLINDTLDISKIESGKMEIVQVEYSLAELLHDVDNMIRVRANKKGLSLKMAVDEDLPGRLYGDDMRIRQILVNLLSNAVKYTREGAVTLRLTGTKEYIKPEKAASLEHLQPCIALHFSVEDTGIGIRKEDQDKLFTDFKRLDQKQNRSIEGTGLGLSITTNLLELMDSRLEVESEYGRGSVFSFTLRQGIRGRKTLGELALELEKKGFDYQYQVSFQAPEAKILVTDDKEMNRKVLRSLLKQTKVQVDEAQNGESCLMMASEQHYDLILLDHRMPHMDGCETLHRLKEQTNSPCADTPVIALTAHAMAGAREWYLNEGFDDYLSKPVDAVLLEKMVARYLPVELLEKPKETMQRTSQEDWAREAARPAALPEVAGVSWDYAMLHLHREDILLEAARDLYAQGETELGKLLQEYAPFAATSQEEYTNHPEAFADAVEAFRIQIHAMKSSSAWIGALGVSELALILEESASEGRLDRIHMELPLFQKRWKELLEGLKALDEKEQKEDALKKPLDDEMLANYLTMLRMALDEDDQDAQEFLLKQLDEFSFSGEKKQRMDELRQSILAFEEERSRELLEQWLEQV